jgi:hypothetical protein
MIGAIDLRTISSGAKAENLFRAGVPQPHHSDAIGENDRVTGVVDDLLA